MYGLRNMDEYSFFVSKYDCIYNFILVKIPKYREKPPIFENRRYDGKKFITFFIDLIMI